MTYLYIGIFLFFGAHFLPIASSLKGALVVRLGAKGYRGLFALISAIGLGLMIWGKVKAGHSALYQPPQWGMSVAYLLTIPALVLLASAHMKGRIRKLAHHPMLLGVLLWSVGHLLANGDLASVWLFGSFALYSALAIMFAGKAGGGAHDYAVKPVHDLMALGGGVGLALVLILYAHSFLFGVKII
ncbi:MAG: NnrU family protein [Robiginitomaculum sp.]|nr:MAG: NnrU family protein [Robiginitomaculum sp.]